MESLRLLWAREPARVTAALAAVVVFLAAKIGVVISEQDVIPSLLIILPIVLAGEQARKSVVPVQDLVADYDDLPDDPVNKPAGIR